MIDPVAVKFLAEDALREINECFETGRMGDLVWASDQIDKIIELCKSKKGGHHEES
jgi:hypothetical protein